jgi:hypothetical protein
MDPQGEFVPSYKINKIKQRSFFLDNRSWMRYVIKHQKLHSGGNCFEFIRSSCPANFLN